MINVKRRREVLVLTSLLTDLYVHTEDDVHFVFSRQDVIDIRNNLDYESTLVLNDKDYEHQLDTAYNKSVLFECEELHNLYYSILTKFIELFDQLNTNDIRFTN